MFLHPARGTLAGIDRLSRPRSGSLVPVFSQESAVTTKRLTQVKRLYISSPQREALSWSDQQSPPAKWDAADLLEERRQKNKAVDSL